MAIWSVTPVEQGTKLELTYRNVLSGRSERLGRADSNTPSKDIVDWIVNEAKPGDVISMGGMLMQYLTPRKA